MKIQIYPDRSEEGSALAHCLWMSMLVGLGAYSLLDLSTTRIRAAHNRTDYNEAFYHAENIMNWAAARIVDNASPAATFTRAAGTLDLPYLNGLNGAGGSGFNDGSVIISALSNGVAKVFTVQASAKVGKKTRTLLATMRKEAPSKVFDYEYFLNNWGWWWGAAITGNGDNRSNWDFDFRFSPSVNGMVTATGEIASNGTLMDPFNTATIPLTGLAKNDPLTYLKDGSESLAMPNLKDLTYYGALATSKGGSLKAGSTIVSGVHTNSAKPGLYLVGTDANPIQINGPVVIPGDVVISGKITGIGTLYVGGNLYIAGDISYKNGPDFSSPPATMAASSRDSWVSTAVSGKKDLVAFAVRESVFGGDVNSSEWKSACYDPAAYGLKNVGGEGSIGADGIMGTPDDGVAYKDTNGDGTADSAWFDADGDGVKDANYTYDGLTMTDARALKIAGYPEKNNGNGNSDKPEKYSDLASNDFNRMDGIFYCNHALALRSTKSGMVGNGAVICRDEAMVFTGSLKFNYDPRIHSRYSSDPNRYIDLGLPLANTIQVLSLEEIVAPIAIVSTGP